MDWLRVNLVKVYLFSCKINSVTLVCSTPEDEGCEVLHSVLSNCKILWSYCDNSTYLIKMLRRIILLNFRSSHRRCFIKTGVLKNFVNFTVKPTVGVNCNFIKRDFNSSVFP